MGRGPAIMSEVREQKVGSRQLAKLVCGKASCGPKQGLG